MGDYLRAAYRASRPRVARRRPDLVLVAIEAWCRLEERLRGPWQRLEDKVRGPVCPICGDRSRVLDAHIYVNHDPAREK